MIKNKLILIGGGGHCKSCIDVIEQENKYEIIGILDKEESIGTTVLGYKVIGTDAKIAELNNKECSFLITIGQIKSPALRETLYLKLENLNAEIATIVSPSAYVSKHAEIRKGNIIMNGSIINAGVKIYENNILNTGCLIEHDVQIGNHCHISTMSVLNGGCKIGNKVFIGSNVTISNQVQICNNVIVGAGTVILKNIDRPGIYVGNPGKKI